MINRLEAIVAKYQEVSEELVKPEVLNDFNRLKKLSKEQSDLKEIVEVYNEYKKILDNLEQAKQMENDPELKDFALEEVTRQQKRKNVGKN